MKQPLKSKNFKKTTKTTKKMPKITKKYGISKLEQYFAHNFLEKLKIKYIYQYSATNIGRYFDFAVTVYDDYPFKYELKEGLNSIKQENDNKWFIAFLIEIDGDYFHSNPQKIDEKKLNPMQKHNKMVDKIKDDWAKMQGIPLLRFWEDDIRNNSTFVLKKLKDWISTAKKKKMIIENKKKPH